MISIALILIILIVGGVVGVLIGSIIVVGRLGYLEWKNKRQWKNGKGVMESKTINKEINQEGLKKDG